MNQTLVNFYAGQGTDNRGRTITEILQWPDSRLEFVHDYIQWLFPLKDASAFNQDAPLLDQETIDEFIRTPEIQRNLLMALDRMLHFYGMRFNLSTVEIIIGPDFHQQAENWLNPGDHNHLRITRILKCLMTLNMTEEARAFYTCLKSIADQTQNRITPKTLQFWKEAVGANVQ